jgi:hypothetical protein
MSMVLKTIKEFHWITKAVIVLTAIPFVLILVAFVAGMSGLSNLSGLAPLVLSLTYILTYVFLVVLVVIVIYTVVTWIKAWIEKYLDAMLAKLDLLAERKTGPGDAGTALAVMNGRVERMETKLDNIERILENVTE